MAECLSELYGGNDVMLWGLQLMASKETRVAFVALLNSLRGRHQYALHSGRGWQGSCARTADAAAASLAIKVCHALHLNPNILAASMRVWRSTLVGNQIRCSNNP